MGEEKIPPENVEKTEEEQVVIPQQPEPPKVFTVESILFKTPATNTDCDRCPSNWDSVLCI